MRLTDSPARRMHDVAAFYGNAAFARRCIPIARGELTDHEAIIWLGGLPGQLFLADPRPDQAYWPRVWAVRALRYVWDDRSAGAVLEALRDPHWRVREMAVKICLRRDLGQANDLVAGLAQDETPRVRAAAAWALGEIGEGEHAEALIGLADDPDRLVRFRAEQALERISRRLERDF